MCSNDRSVQRTWSRLSVGFKSLHCINFVHDNSLQFIALLINKLSKTYRLVGTKSILFTIGSRRIFWHIKHTDDRNLFTWLIVVLRFHWIFNFSPSPRPILHRIGLTRPALRFSGSWLSVKGIIVKSNGCWGPESLPKMITFIYTVIISCMRFCFNEGITYLASVLVSPLNPWNIFFWTNECIIPISTLFRAAIGLVISKTIKLPDIDVVN